MSSTESSAESSARRRRRWIIGASLAALGLGAGAFLLAAGAFDVERVDISGVHRVSYDEALAASGIGLGDFMPTLNAGRARQGLRELPWVLDAQIRRRWPNAVEVHVTERSAVAMALSAPQEWVLVDAHGRVLTPPLQVLPPLARLSGIAAAPHPGGFLGEDAAALLEVLDIAAQQQGFAVAALWRDGRGEMRARVSQRPIDGQPGRLPGGLGEVVLGDDSAVAAKVAAVAAVVTDLAADLEADLAADLPADLESSGAVLDVSVPRLPVLRRADSQS